MKTLETWKEKFMVWLFKKFAPRIVKETSPDSSKQFEDKSEVTHQVFEVKTCDQDEFKALQKAITEILQGPRPQAEPWPENNSKPQSSRPKPTSTKEILGQAAPCDFSASGATPEKFHHLSKLSRQLQKKIKAASEDFDFDSSGKLSHEDRLYVLFDAHAAVCAEAGCSDKTIKESNLTIPDTLMTLVELVQHNYFEKQKTMYDQLGNWVH